jgi:hypothetical protein
VPSVKILFIKSFLNFLQMAHYISQLEYMSVFVSLNEMQTYALLPSCSSTSFILEHLCGDVMVTVV